MNKSNLKDVNKSNLKELPCTHCIKYMAEDLKNNRIIRDRAEIITYLNNISDPNITGKLLNLLRSMAHL